MVVYNFKKIRPVPTSTEFVDIVLSGTQRRTPTVVHPGYAIGRIRAFYMRKVKFTQEAFTERLGNILEDFPRLDDIHPFYADLCNVLYDRDHYKLALGQLNTAKHLIATLSKDYVRLLKYGDSLYRCKQLKRAALGRMCTLMKKHKASLAYLEEVRKHLSRLPSIDPNTRTLLITGYPNVGKSSFMNKVTRADVEVEPYAFTTKSLFVGHMDYKYLRWQVLDTPGILDKPLEERNTIEMQAVTALAHLQCCVLYFMDLSEQCGWSVEQQAKLFENIRPLFANKPLVIVVNKIDVMPFESLEADKKKIIEDLASTSGALLLPMSTFTEVGVNDVKQRSCELLLEQRVERKVKSSKINNVLNRLNVAMPSGERRDTCIPASVLAARARKRAVKNGELSEEDAQSARKTQKEIMWEKGGPGVYAMDYREHHMLQNDEWKRDVMPEIMDGKNISDFVDPAIAARLEELEREEEAREADEAEAGEDSDSDLDEEEKTTLHRIKEKKAKVVAKHRREKTLRAKVPRKFAAATRSRAEFKEGLASTGHDVSDVTPQVARGRKRDRSRSAAPRAEDGARSKSRGASRGRSKSAAARSLSVVPGEGFRNVRQKLEAKALMKKSQKKMQQMGRAGHADRYIGTKMPQHLFSGKRKKGKTDRR